MTDVMVLERRYRRWLLVYPPTFRRHHGADLIAVLLDSAEPDRRVPQLAECWHLWLGALSAWFRPRIPAADRTSWTLTKLFYLAAAAQLAVSVMVATTMGDIRSAVVAKNPQFSAAQWHAEVVGALHPLVIDSSIEVPIWLVLAWATGRGHRWPLIGLLVLLGLTSPSLVTGVLHGSASVARLDLVTGVVLWLVQVAIAGAAFRQWRSRAVRPA